MKRGELRDVGSVRIVGGGKPSGIGVEVGAAGLKEITTVQLAFS
jgi:hypothetical protein